MKWVLSAILVAITSMYIFPIEFRFLPSINTKMFMAVLGIGAFVINSILKRQSTLQKKVIHAALLAAGVSLVGIISVLYNNTSDYTYASYFVSFVVWTFASYFVITCIRVVHKNVSVVLVCKYLIAVAIMQCVMAVMIDLLPTFKNAVNSFVVGFASMYSAGEGIEKAGRLYGIGAALDVAGTRFCAILSIMGILSQKAYMRGDRVHCGIYMFLMVVLLVLGSMISRTTGIGFVFIFLYYILGAIRDSRGKSFFCQMLIGLTILAVLCVILYNNSIFFHQNLRFAFEGFFNYFEQGDWRLTSTDALRNMYIFPDSFKTWLIGDAYFDEPYHTDPYYVGEHVKAGLFYMATDVGYIRFIFYFGLFGLITFVLYFAVVTKDCIADFPNQKWIFIALLSMNLLIWFKVATDIFCLFALFLCISKEDNDAYEKQYENPLPDPLDM